MLTADTITDEQIRELRAETRARLPRTKHESRSEALGIIETCMLALNEAPLQTRADVHADARARCAEILNARTAKE
jgi:hypothetical protein